MAMKAAIVADDKAGIVVDEKDVDRLGHEFLSDVYGRVAEPRPAYTWELQARCGVIVRVRAGCKFPPEITCLRCIVQRVRDAVT